MTELSIVLVAAVVIQVALAYPFVLRLRRTGGTLSAALWLTGALLLAAGLLRLAFFALGLEVDRNDTALWGGTSILSAAAGFLCTYRLRRMPTLLELFLALLLLFEAVAAYVLWSGGGSDVAAPSLRALLPGPAAVALCLYFGASFSFLLSSSGPDLGLGYEALIGRRFLLSKSSAVLSVVTAISVVGVALGVALVIFALAVLGGFEKDLERKIIGANAHAVLQTKDGMPFTLDESVLNELAKVPGVEAEAPYLEGEVAIASQSNNTAAVLFGIDPRRTPDVLAVLGPEQLSRGTLQPLLDEMGPQKPREIAFDAEFMPPAPVPSIVIGREMAHSLSVDVGDRVRVISPVLETLAPVVGVVPSTKDFRIAAIFSSDMYEFDARFAYVALPSARRFFEVGAREVHGVQLRVSDPELSDSIGDAALAVLAARHPQAPLETLDWKRRNQTLFAALKLERVVAFVVLAFIILVASFSVVNTITMSVIEKRKEIAILMTMGARRVGIMKLFLVQGMVVGALGTAIGAAGGVALALAFKILGFGIPQDVYYIESLPVHLGPGDVVLVMAAALLILWDFSVFPALRGSQLEPVEGLRDG